MQQEPLILFFLIFKFYFIYFLYSRFLLVIHFIHISVYMSIPISQFIPPLPFPPWYPYVCSLHLCLNFCTANCPVPLYHFARFQIYALIYDIFFFLSDLIHSVWQSLGPSTSLQMTQFRSFLWLSNIPLYIYIYITSSLSIPLLMDI